MPTQSVELTHDGGWKHLLDISWSVAGTFWVGLVALVVLFTILFKLSDIHKELLIHNAAHASIEQAETSK